MKKRILSLALASAMAVGTVGGAFAETESTVEVKNSPQYINGYEDGTFKANNNVSRAEIAKMVAILQGLEETGESFDDVPNTHWAAGFIGAVQEAGIVKGDDLGNFNPLAGLTRAELATIVSRVIGEVEGEGMEFSDVEGHWAEDAIAKVSAAGIINGYPEGDFRPNANVTRAEAVKMLNAGLLGMLSVDSEIADKVENPFSDNLGWAKDHILAASTEYEYTLGEDGKMTIVTEEENDLSVESISAINSTTVEVDFKESIDDIEALNFTIEGLTVSNAAVKQTDDSVAVLTTSEQTGATKYTVKEGETVLGSFDGVSSVIPTSISIETSSVQSAVGKEVTLKANIGQAAAGVKVTFNVDADASLNEDRIVEVVTDANGIASYTYTQYAAGIDTVAVYPTGAPAVRAIASVYWGQSQVLTVVEETTGNVSNQDVKTYDVKLVHPTTGEPLRGVELGVTFAENVDTTALGTDAVATDPITNNSVVPYQSSTGERILTIKTNVDGEASFTVTGANTTATPIVFLDQAVVAGNALDGTGLRGDGDGRLDARELQAKATAAVFVGVQQDYKIAFDITSSTEAVTGQAKEYAFQVFKADGTTPWAGGTVYVGFDELQDNILTTNTTATILGNDKVDDLVAGGTVARIELDSEGKGSFDVVGGLNVTATPTAWVNLNDQSAANNLVREAGEAFANAGSVTFRDEVANNVLLDLNNDGNGDTGHNGLYTDVAGTEEIAYNLQLRNQSNNLTTTAKMDKVTYVIRNTGNKAVTVTFGTPNWTPDQSIAAPITIAAGNSFTLSGNANGNAKEAGLVGVNTAGLTVTPVAGSEGTIEVAASATTLSVAAPNDANNRNNGLNLASDKMTAVWVDAQEVAQELTGEVVGYRTLDTAAGENGYVIVKLDGVDGYAVYNYGTPQDNFYVGTQNNFASLTATDIDVFEEAISLGDKISINANALDGVRLINSDSSKDSDQADTNTPGGAVVEEGIAAGFVATTVGTTGPNVTIPAVPAGNRAYFAPAGALNLAQITAVAAGSQSGPAVAGATTLAAPTDAGTYVLYYVDAFGNIVDKSTAVLTVDAAVTALAAINAELPAGTLTNITTILLENAGVANVIDVPNTTTAYQTRLAAVSTAKGSNLTLAEVQAAINAVNANLLVTLNTDFTDATIAELDEAGVVGAVAGNLATYQADLDAAQTAKGSNLTLVEVQTIVDDVNTAATAAAALVTINADSANNFVNVIVTDLEDAGVTGVVAASLADYQAELTSAFIANGGAAFTLADLQTAVDTVNAL